MTYNAPSASRSALDVAPPEKTSRWSVRIVVALALMGAPVTASQGAAITWNTPTNDTGNLSDFVTTGSLFDAVTSNPTLTVDGITFNGQSSYSSGAVTFSNSQITGAGFTSGDYYTNPRTSPSGTWNASYATLVDQGGDNAATNGSSSLTIGGLTIGQQYLVQIFMPFWDGAWNTAFTAGGSTSALVAPGNYNQSTPDAQYITGTFTANATTETISLSSPSPVALFDAIQVRTQGATVSVPEPSALVLFATSILVLGAALRSRKRKGIA